jgi:hypothetical protein
MLQGNGDFRGSLLLLRNTWRLDIFSMQGKRVPIAVGIIIGVGVGIGIGIEGQKMGFGREKRYVL